MVRLGVLYTPNHGSSPCKQTMKKELTDNIINEAQALYNEIGNIKKVAKEIHISYDILRNFIKSEKITPKKRDTSSYRRNIKQRLIEYKGGKCQICGYNRCQEALDFHHINQSEKDYTISGGTKSFETLKKEVDKCILVCANCHREIHAGITKTVYDEKTLNKITRML